MGGNKLLKGESAIDQGRGLYITDWVGTCVPIGSRVFWGMCSLQGSQEPQQCATLDMQFSSIIGMPILFSCVERQIEL